jgi:hypothetical protein
MGDNDSEEMSLLHPKPFRRKTHPRLFLFLPRESKPAREASRDPLTFSNQAPDRLRFPLKAGGKETIIFSFGRNYDGVSIF